MTIEFAPVDRKKAKKQKNETPLEYMLRVMNDDEVPEARRDRMAVAAAPYCHPKLTGTAPGKKEQQTEAAAHAGLGTPWAGDIEFEIRPQ